VIDFQFTATIEHLLSGDEIGEQFATIYAISNIAALVVQLCYGLLAMALPGIQIRWVLMVLPCTILLGSVVFIVFPILWVGSLLNTADSAFAYSVNQTARETLYVPISRNEKYKARAFIEMFLQRTAKVVAIGVTLAITFLFTTKGADGSPVLNFDGLRWLSLFTCAVIAVWFYCVGIVGRKFEALRRDQTEPDDTALGQAQEQPSAGAA
jgi:AAA family ATP:ADP antiporter